MDRRKALTTILAAPLAEMAVFRVLDKNSDHIDLEEGTAVAAIRYNGKSYALGFKIVPDKPDANIKAFTWLAETLSRTGKLLVLGKTITEK